MTTPGSANRPELRLLSGAAEAPVEHGWFCGYCAAGPAAVPPASPHARVCQSCGFGLMLEARADLLPTPRDAFVIVDSRLLLQAVSRRAEGLLGVSEDHGVNRPLSEVLVAADAEAAAPGALSELILNAVAAGGYAQTFVRPRNTFGVRLRTRIGACGPPRAALVVLDGDPRHLRVV